MVIIHVEESGIRIGIKDGQVHVLPSLQSEVEEVSTGKIGKLTGTKIRQIHANDQLEAILNHKYDKLLTRLATLSTEDFKEYIQDSSDNSYRDCNEDVVFRALHAAVMFATIEIHERGLGSSEEPDSQEEG